MILSLFWSILIWGFICLSIILLAGLLVSGRFYLWLFNSRKYIYIIRIGACMCVYILVRTYLVDIYRITGHSMEPTLLDGDYVLVWKSAYGYPIWDSFFEHSAHSTNPIQGKKFLKGFQQIERGDIVMCNMPIYQHTRIVKRCTQIPGDVIDISAIEKPGTTNKLPHRGQILTGHIDSLSILEKRIIQHYYSNILHRNKQINFRFPQSFYYLTGDNPTSSTDSRTWGAIPQDHISGKIILILISRDTNGTIRKKRFFQKVF